MKTEMKITNKLSADTVCSMVLAGVSELCYHRGLFPTDCFDTPVPVGGMEGLKPNMLRFNEEGCDEAANTLMQWLTQALPDAVERGYAKRFIFGITQDERASQLLEEYIFSFEYDSAGNIRCSLPTTKRSSKPDAESVRHQVVRLMRSIVSVVKTLDKVPDERWLFAKMEYCDGCPADYEPPYFEPAGDRAVGYFPTKPFAMRFGGLATPYHTLDVGCRSVLDQVDVRPGQGPTADDISRFETTRGGWTGNDEPYAAAAESETDAEDDAFHRRHVDTAQLFDDSQPPAAVAASTPASSGFAPDRGVLRLVCELESWVGGRARVSALAALRRFPDAAVATVEAGLGMLVARGVLRRTRDPDSFEVAPLAVLGGNDDAQATERMGGLHVGAAKPRATEMLSKAGGIHSVPGSARTQSVVAGAAAAVFKRARGSGAGADSEVQGNVWPHTQGSDMGEDVEEERRRKVSMGQRAIRQQEAARATPAAGARKMQLRTKVTKGGRLSAMRG